MYFKQIFVFALLALVAVQGATHLREVNSNEPSTFGLIGIARKAIQELINIVEKTVEIALNTLRKIGQGIIITAKNIVKEAIQAVVDEIKRIRDNIEAIKNQAVELGVDIKECLGENQNALIELPKKTIRNIVKCATDEVAEAEDIISSAIAEIIEIKDTVADMPENLNKCLHTWRPINCTTHLVADVVEAIDSIPIVITGKVNEVIRLVTNIESDMKTCVNRRVLEASLKAAIISARITKCISEKIREHDNYLE